MFSSPLLPVDRTRLPPWVRAWVGRRLSGPPPGGRRQHWTAVIYQLDRLGDFVLAASAIRRLLETWGETRCLLVVSSAAAPLARREFPRTPIIALQTTAPSVARDLLPAWWRERPKLRGHTADHVICFSHHRNLYKQTALSWINAPHVLALDRTTYPQSADLPWCLELLAHRQLVESALGSPVTLDAIKPRLTSLHASDGNDLVVCPLAEEKERCLPETVLRAALIAWRKRSNARIVLSGLPFGAGWLTHAAAALARDAVTNVRIEVNDTFDGFVERIAGAGAVLAVDSGPAHLATALDKRLVLIPGGGRFGLSSPWQSSTRQVVVENRLPCYGCGWRCTQPEPFCLTALSGDAIAAVLPTLP